MSASRNVVRPKIFLEAFIFRDKGFLRFCIRFGRNAAGLMKGETVALQPVGHAAHRISCVDMRADMRDFHVKMRVQMGKRRRHLRAKNPPNRRSVA